MAPTVSDMFFFAHGPGLRNGKKVVAVFFGFFDASNTHRGATVWSLCGFLGDEPAFTSLDNDWKTVLDKPKWPARLSRFHMVDCVHGTGEFVGWTFAERLAIFGDLASVIMATQPQLVAVSSVVIREDFDKLDAEERALLESEGLGTALDLSLQSILQRSIQLTRQTSDTAEIGLLFDNENPESSVRILEFASLYKGKFGFEKWFAGIGFGESVKFTPLQAADVLAYCTYRFSMQKYPDLPQPDFPVLPGFERMVRATLHDVKGGFDLESMRKLAVEIRQRHARL